MQQMVPAEDWSWRLWLYCISFGFIFNFYDLFALLSQNLFVIPSFHIPGLNNLLMAYDDKSAYALCAFSFAVGPDSEPITFIGKTSVYIFFFLHLLEETDAHDELIRNFGLES